MKKYARYQDYVIKDGKMVGEFDQMYQDFADPWEQTTREKYGCEKAVALNLIQKVGAKRVLELGCGLGHFTHKIWDDHTSVLGVDCSETAIIKAQKNYPECQFLVADILDKKVYEDFKPDMIIMAEITWYVLDKLDDFINLLKNDLKHVYLLHLLAIYPPGVQKYGADKFTNLKEIMAYFKMDYLEWGEMHSKGDDIRTYFLTKPSSQ